MRMRTLWNAVKRNRSLILTILSSLGVVGTGVAAFYAGRKYEADPDADWKVMIRPVVVGGATITGIILSYVTGVKEIAVLTGTAGYAIVNRNKLERAIKDKYGDEEIERIKEEAQKLIAKNSFKKHKMNVEETGHGNVLCFESYFGRWFRADPEWVNQAIDRMNEAYEQSQYGIAYNEFYHQVHISDTGVGSDFGYPKSDLPWDPQEDAGILFDAHMVDWWLDGEDDLIGEEVLYISPITPPVEYWEASEYYAQDI